jgi:hypothetical protein
MAELNLSLAQARALHLEALGLLKPPRKKAVKADVLAAIRRMGVLQIDTIHVVARSPYLVLWSRLGAYPQAWLEELLAEGALFEYWAHEACFVPIEDYRLFRHRMLDPAAMGWKYSVQWMKDNKKDIAALTEHIRVNGPVKSSDFKRTDGQAGGWWSWKPEKRSLEVLFTAGHLMIAKRHNFQRIYDLAERILPHWDDKKHLPAMAETREALLLKAVHALGVCKAAWTADYFRTGRSRPAPDPEALVKQGRLLRVKVDGWDVPGYIHPDNLALAQQAAAGALKPTLTTILSPFDPLVWDRKRVSDLFGFDYRIECYTPEAKRRYGYFTLPILYRGALIGRLDAKAHRSAGVFEVKVIHLEPGVKVSQAMTDAVAGALQRCADWHGTATVKIVKSAPRTFAKALKDALAA